MGFNCTLCPRNCGVFRDDDTAAGFCRSAAAPRIARAAAHFGEEPCLSGEKGAGAVFFTGCNLSCVYCQNADISRGQGGSAVSVAELRDIFLRLQDEGVHCIDLVTGTHFTPFIAEALSGVKLDIPVVWNSSGYEKVETLRMLDGLVQIYMPDFKYWDAELARRYSSAPDYRETAAAAIKEMYRQTGDFVMDENGLLRSGVLIRHLILPGEINNSMDVIDFVADEFPRGSVLFSLMSQYTPMPGLEKFPKLLSRVDDETNERLISYMHTRHIEAGYWQDSASATKDMIPDFDGTGVN